MQWTCKNSADTFKKIWQCCRKLCFFSLPHKQNAQLQIRQLTIAVCFQSEAIIAGVTISGSSGACFTVRAHAKYKENIVLQWSLSILYIALLSNNTYHIDRQNRLTDHQVHLISHISKHFAIHPHWNTLSLPTLQYRERQREREETESREGERERGREGERERGREGERERERERKREREQILLSMSTIIKNHYITVDWAFGDG